MTDSLNVSGAKACRACEAGYFTPRSTQNCTRCPAGSVTDALKARGATRCEACRAGRFSAEPTAACTECGAGRFVSSTGASSNSSCIGCPAGHFVPVTGSTSVSACEVCAAGSVTFRLLEVVCGQWCDRVCAKIPTSYPCSSIDAMQKLRQLVSYHVSSIMYCLMFPTYSYKQTTSLLTR